MESARGPTEREEVKRKCERKERKKEGRKEAMEEGRRENPFSIPPKSI